MLRGCGEARSLARPEVLTQRSPTSPDYPLELGRDGHVLSVPNGGNTARSGNEFNLDAASGLLAEIVGAGDVSLQQSSQIVLVAPGSIEEASEVMKLASSERWAVVPAGATTWLDAGLPLKQFNVIVSTRRLNQIVEHEPADLVGSAQAGVTLETFNKVLARGGQWLPLDPPDDGQATLGGIVSTGLAGAQKFGYGSPRNFVIGMRVVLPNGKIAKAGGRVVKNVAGYDLCKLFTGSYGTLCLIAELTFKLRPLPAAQVTVLAEGSFDAALKAAWSIHQAHLFPVAIELLSVEMAKKIGIGISTNNVLLLIRFAGIEKTVHYQVDRANQILARNKRVSRLNRTLTINLFGEDLRERQANSISRSFGERASVHTSFVSFSGRFERETLIAFRHRSGKLGLLRGVYA